jgi:hypothetical protein
MIVKELQYMYYHIIFFRIHPVQTAGQLNENVIRYFSTDARFPGDGQCVVTVVALLNAYISRTYSQLRSTVGKFRLLR